MYFVFLSNFYTFHYFLNVLKAPTTTSKIETTASQSISISSTATTEETTTDEPTTFPTTSFSTKIDETTTDKSTIYSTTNDKTTSHKIETSSQTLENSVDYLSMGLSTFLKSDFLSTGRKQPLSTSQGFISSIILSSKKNKLTFKPTKEEIHPVTQATNATIEILFTTKKQSLTEFFTKISNKKQTLVTSEETFSLSSISQLFRRESKELVTTSSPKISDLTTFDKSDTISTDKKKKFLWKMPTEEAPKGLFSLN